jgi:hypothetical protein
MYYYIAESVTTQAERRRLDDIKALLSQLGIAGEFAVASPSRSIEDHLELAFSKGFTTIVGIGSDALICRVAGSILGHKYDKAVLGVIPLASDQVTARMIGASGLTQITAILRTRETLEIDAIQFGRNQASITTALTELPAEAEFRLRYKDALLEGSFTNLSIEPNGQVKIWKKDVKRSSNVFNQLFASQKDRDNVSLTRLQLDRWDFATKESCSLTVNGVPIAETPFQAIHRKKALKLIVNRATITPVKDQND